MFDSLHVSIEQTEGGLPLRARQPGTPAMLEWITSESQISPQSSSIETSDFGLSF